MASIPEALPMTLLGNYHPLNIMNILTIIITDLFCLPVFKLYTNEIIIHIYMYICVCLLHLTFCNVYPCRIWWFNLTVIYYFIVWMHHNLCLHSNTDRQDAISFYWCCCEHLYTRLFWRGVRKVHICVYAYCIYT
jgi:hypothetical protein